MLLEFEEPVVFLFETWNRCGKLRVDELGKDVRFEVRVMVVFLSKVLNHIIPVPHDEQR